MIEIQLRTFFRFVREHISVTISVIVCFVIFSFLIFVVKSYLSNKDIYNLEQTQVSGLRLRADILQKSSSIIQGDLDEENLLLTQLIPDVEDFFSIALAIEKLSLRTQFSISSYTVMLRNTTKEKTTIEIEGTGDDQAFMKFLEDYSFGGGRFATSERIQLTNAQQQNTRIILNFYNKKVSEVGSTTVPQLTKKDLAFINEVKSKIQYNFISDEEPVEEDYAVKSSLF